MRDNFLKLALVGGLAASLALVAVPLAVRAHEWGRDSDRDRGDWNAHSWSDESSEEEWGDNNDEDWNDDEMRNEEDKIESARSAAPESVSEDATVIDWPDASGVMPLLLEGSNGWTCLPDYPESPGNDPMCVDETSMEWMEAYMNHADPHLSQIGIAYMLQGASDASNTDPFATEPAPGEDWMSAPPHIMIFPAGNIDEDLYGTDPESGYPWAMFPGTPYEHFMIPVE